jgi:hypothetical protein
MKKLISAACLLIAWNAAMADPAAPTVNTKAAATPASTASIYTPRHKSVFAATGGEHNPFWPIGWTKAESLSTGDTEAPVTPQSNDFTVTTIMMNEPPIAVINGQDMAEGEVASLPVGGRNVMVQLMAVHDGWVILRWQNQNLTVPLHRDEDLSASALGQADSTPEVAQH